jgi:hypothetical protein
MLALERIDMKKLLYCSSCRRSNQKGPNGVETIEDHGVVWCTSCAKIVQIKSGVKGIALPSPGRMHEGHDEDPLEAWEDCYVKQIKKRILIKKAKSEIQRAWSLWEKDKNDSETMFSFFCWMTRYRPYFVTFRCQGDPWQTVHGWLNEYEMNKHEKC